MPTQPGRTAALATAARHSGTDDGGLPAVEFGLAGTVEALDGAFRLVHDRYVWRGFMTPHPSGRRVSAHHALPTTKVFVASIGSQVVGTVTLIEDSPLGLPMDEIYGRELNRFRARGHRLSEASALAAHPNYRSGGLLLCFRLMRVLLLYAMDLAPLDLLCIAVNPRHLEFYRRTLPFEVFGELKSYEKVNGAPAVALRLDLERVRETVAAVRTTRHAVDHLLRAFFSDREHASIPERLLEQAQAATAASALFFRSHARECATKERASVPRPSSRKRFASVARSSVSSA